MEVSGLVGILSLCLRNELKNAEHCKIEIMRLSHGILERPPSCASRMPFITVLPGIPIPPSRHNPAIRALLAFGAFEQELKPPPNP
jgi:hypothetical protein